MPNENSLKNLKVFDSNQDREKASMNGKKGGIASGQAKREKKTLQELMKLWFEQEATGTLKKKLQDANAPDLTNKSIMIMALAKNIAKGDIKSIQYAAQLAREDEKRELENKKLREEIAKLKLEQEILKQEQETGIIIEDTANLAKMLAMDTPIEEESNEESKEEEQ